MQGCICRRCKRRYKVDIIVPDDLWAKINPWIGDAEGSMLCGPCIAEGIEALDEFAAWKLVRLA